MAADPEIMSLWLYPSVPLNGDDNADEAAEVAQYIHTAGLGLGTDY